VVLFTETLDDAIPQNHPIRLLDRCLDEMDWTLWENRYDGRRGQPPIHPRLVAGCILYGLMRGLRTTRALEDATTNRLDFMWFLERRTIDHSTFADFQVEFKKELKDLNRQISRIVCEGWIAALLELVVDGTRMRANSAYMSTGTDFRPSNPANRPDPTQPVAPDQWSKLPRHNKRLAKPAFVYDSEKNVYYCPMGKPLVFTSNGADTDSYTCPGKTDCPLANECVKGKAGHRKITRDSHQHLRDKVGRRMAAETGMKIYKKRAPVVEGVFGVIKHAMGVRRFLLRGLEKARAEWTWVCTAFNLKKLLRIWALNPPGAGA
jgi:transposase